MRRKRNMKKDYNIISKVLRYKIQQADNKLEKARLQLQEAYFTKKKLVEKYNYCLEMSSATEKPKIIS